MLVLVAGAGLLVALLLCAVETYEIIRYKQGGLPSTLFWVGVFVVLFAAACCLRDSLQFL